ncbi:MAG: BamA/TamA family outer membrane protein [Roseicyclus sp.]
MAALQMACTRPVLAAATAPGVAAALLAATPAISGTTGELVTGVSHSAVHGGTAFADIVVDDAFGSGVTLDFRARGGPEGHALQLGAGGTSPLGGSFPGDDTELYWRVGLSASDWEAESFASRDAEVALGLGADLSATLSYAAEVFWDGVTTTDLDPSLSALILRDEGRATAYGLGLSLAYDARDGAGLLAPGTEMGASLRWAASPEDRDWTQVSLSARHVVRLGPGGLRLEASGGAIEGRAEDGWVPIHDRAFLGGSAPRGFAYGGLGPRDAVTGDALGGTRFALASAEYLVPVRGNLHVGVFADAGSLWSLPGGGTDVVGEAFDLRSSYGLTVAWEGNFGTFSLSLADPVSRRDYDEVQTLSLSLEASF